MLKFLAFLLGAAALIVSCSVPNLEEPDCAEARLAVKQFYSFHFGNDMKFSPENLALREKFLTDALKNEMRQKKGEEDFFTVKSNDYPKAFRPGGCRLAASGKAEFDIKLFWKSESRSEEKDIKIEAIKENGKWLINKIY